MTTLDLRHRQAGVAAIEMGLTLVVLLMLIFAIVGYGALFWVQQSLSVVAADTARHAAVESYTQPQADVTTDAADYACKAAGQVPMLLAALGASGESSISGGTPVCAGFASVQSPDSTGVEACASVPKFRCLKVTLNLTVDSWPLMNTLGQLAGVFSSSSEDWVPKSLQASATVLIAAAPSSPS
ncbi:hypothetical protein CDEF62S_00956 [Castellaniella defragrans]